MTFAEFVNLDEFEKFKNSKCLSLENEEEIIKFYKKAYSETLPPFYHCMPLYNSATNTKNFRYIVIEDDVFISFKIIQIMNTKQIRIFDTPISLSDDNLLVSMIIDRLMMLPFVKIASKENEYGFKGEALNEYNDYFVDFSNHNFNGQFKSKNGINKMLKDERFKIEILNYVDYSKVENLRNQWVKGMKENGSEVSNGNTNIFKKIITFDNPRIVNALLLFNGSPISIQTFLIDFDLNFADCLHINHLGRISSEDEMLNKVLKNMCDIQKWIAFETLKEYGISRMYLAGCRPSEKRLLKHKEKISDGVIKYKLIGGVA